MLQGSISLGDLLRSYPEERNLTQKVGLGSSVIITTS